MNETLKEVQASELPLVILKKGREQSLSRYHRWIFSRAIAEVLPMAELGDMVSIVNAQGKYLATGTWEGGNIAVRILEFGAPIIDEASFFREKLQKALYLRLQLRLYRPALDTNTNTIFRLVYGESDGLSGLIVDIYGHTAVIQAHSVGIYRRVELLKNLLLELPLNIKAIYNKSSSTLTELPINYLGDGYLHGKHIEEPLYEEGLRFLADIDRGQKTGFFIDQRENRQLVEKFASGKRILNCFCYTGGFSAYALRGGAQEVHSLDSSNRALAVAEEMLRLNFNKDIISHHKSINADAFDYLHTLEPDSYDMIILDPPAFAKSRNHVRNACNGYRKLNALALKKITSGGMLFTFSCSQLVTPYDFRMAILTAAVESRRNVRILRQLSQAACHPINIFHPETEYLKGLLLYID